MTDASGSPEVRIRSAPTRGRGRSAAAGDPNAIVRRSRLRCGCHRTGNASPSEPMLPSISSGSIRPRVGSRVRLDAETTDQHGPSWSPDGNWIAYRRLSNGSWELVKTPLGGGQIVRLDDAAPGGAATDWSPTGRWIAHWRPDGMHLVSPEDASKRYSQDLARPVSFFT